MSRVQVNTGRVEAVYEGWSITLYCSDSTQGSHFSLATCQRVFAAYKALIRKPRRWWEYNAKKKKGLREIVYGDVNWIKLPRNGACCWQALVKSNPQLLVS